MTFESDQVYSKRNGRQNDFGNMSISLNPSLGQSPNTSIGNEPWQFDNVNWWPRSEMLSFSEVPASCVSGYNFNDSLFTNMGVVSPDAGFLAPTIPNLYSAPLAITPQTQAGESLTLSTEGLEGSVCAPTGSADGALPAPRSTWTIEQERYLLEAKKSGCSLKDISAAMNEKFGIERNANVLSKKYRAIRDRSSPESVSESFCLASLW